MVVDQSRLEPAVLQFAPFEVLGGSHGADLKTEDRRFFQYEYRLRLIAENMFGKDAALPDLKISYRVQSKVSQKTSLQGRDQTYVMPATSVRILSLVPADATDIRDSATETFTDLDQRALHSYGLSAQDVGDALAAQNQITPVGTEKIGKFEYTINLNDSPKRIEEFNDLPINVVNGPVVYMRDVAYVHDSAPPQTNVVQLEGKKGVLLTVLKAGSVSTLDIIADIKRLLPVIKESMPPDLEMKFVGDQSRFVTGQTIPVDGGTLSAGGWYGRADGRGWTNMPDQP